MEEGYLEGENCNRYECSGIIEEHDSDGCCSCHINPPCSFCETSRAYCPKCEWDGEEEQSEEVDSYKPSKEQIENWNKESKKREENKNKFWDLFKNEEEVSTLHCIYQSHSNSSMLKIGIYPKNMTIENLLKEIRGTFGGRFQLHNRETRRFKYIAYSD